MTEKPKEGCCARTLVSWGRLTGQCPTMHYIATKWWWEEMLGEVKRFAASFPECALVAESGRVARPPLHPIPVSRPLGIDIIDLPPMDQGNKHVIVMQDLFMKWPMVYLVYTWPEDHTYSKVNSWWSDPNVWSPRVPLLRSRNLPPVKFDDGFVPNIGY